MPNPIYFMLTYFISRTPRDTFFERSNRDPGSRILLRRCVCGCVWPRCKHDVIVGMGPRSLIYFLWTYFTFAPLLAILWNTENPNLLSTRSYFMCVPTFNEGWVLLLLLLLFFYWHSYHGLNIIFQIQEILLQFFMKIGKFHHFFTFWWRGSAVENTGLIEHGSWYSHKIKLQYDIKDLNVTNQ